MIFVAAGLVPAHNGGKHKALPLQNVNDFLIGINSNLVGLTQKGKIPPSVLPKGREVLLPRPVGEGRGEGSA